MLMLITEHLNSIILDKNIISRVWLCPETITWLYVTRVEICNEFASDKTFFFYCIRFYFLGGHLVQYYAVSKQVKTSRVVKTG